MPPSLGFIGVNRANLKESTMALINRLARLVTADMHAVLDRIEEPESLLKQAVREMEEELAAGEQRLRHLRRDRDRMKTHREELEQTLAQLEEELDSCFAAGEDTLARAVIRHKLEGEQAYQSIVKRGADIDQHLSQCEAALNEHRIRLDSMRQKSELLAEDTSAGDGFRACDGNERSSLRDEDVEVAFLREKQRRSRP
jgi:phage shock protein A